MKSFQSTKGEREKERISKISLFTIKIESRVFLDFEYIRVVIGKENQGKVREF